jgi:hypothetical protein
MKWYLAAETSDDSAVLSRSPWNILPFDQLPNENNVFGLDNFRLERVNRALWQTLRFKRAAIRR